MKSKPTVIEAITLRRATIADTDKVRYRVYSTPTEFIAVIAESALMAVKVAGIRKPHKIVRDLPTEGVAIEAKKMAAIDTAAARIAMPVKKTDKPEQLSAELKPVDPNLIQTLFRPMNIGDLQAKGISRARILPPELLSEIIEQHARSTMPQAPVAPPPAPVQQVPEPAPVSPVPPEPEPTPQERIVEMAKDVVPPAPEPEGDVELSAEEVAKLLNG
jgi:hypothetical protein